MNSIDFSSLPQSLLSAITSNWGIGGAILLALAILMWVVRRTGSTYTPVRWLWQILFGKSKTSSLTAFFEERDELMHFRAVTGVKNVPDLNAAHRLVQWTKAKKIDMDLIRSVTGHFDVTTLEFRAKPPGNVAQVILTVLCAVLIYATVAVAVMAALSPAGLKIIKTGTWYFVSDTATYQPRLFGDALPRFSRDGCKDVARTAAATGYPVQDVQAFCEVLDSKEGQALLLETRITQRKMGTVLGLVLLLASMKVFSAVVRVNRTQELYKIVNGQ
jgi:hypothetical protein